MTTTPSPRSGPPGVGTAADPATAAAAARTDDARPAPAPAVPDLATADRQVGAHAAGSRPTASRPTAVGPTAVGPVAARWVRAAFRRAPLLAAVAATALLVAAPPPATAAEAGPGAPADTTPPVKINPNDPDLRMPGTAKLAPGRVLDIKSVVESDDGTERREDTNAKVAFTLQSEVLFSKDSAKLNGDANARIKAIAQEIKKQGAHTVRVFGFTDNLGSAEHGLVLSKQRANAVQRQLAGDLDPSVSYQIRGYGEQYPIADNSTEAGRKKNRRVEVSFPRTG